MARKKLTKAQRDLKNKLDRTRRFLEKNIIQAKKNGWALKQGMWFGKHSACLFGLVLANNADLGKKDDLKDYFDGQFSKHSEEEQAAAASGLHRDEVDCIIEGFDAQESADDIRSSAEDIWLDDPRSMDDDANDIPPTEAWLKKEMDKIRKERTFGHYDPTSIQGKFHALGWRLAEKHVERSEKRK